MSPTLGEDARQRLHDTFATLCRIESPTGHERECADWITRELEGFGLEVTEDDAGSSVDADAGNLLVRIPGRDESRWIMLCAHMDTVPLTAPVDPVLQDGGWENAGDGILGADNKAAVAALVELARCLSQRDDPPEVGVELLFTVSEETGLRGAGAFDASTLRSPFGYVFDHASPLGEIITAAPTLTRVIAEIRGRAAHAGLQPEAGRSAIVAAARAVDAMTLGRLDEETTANVGVIAGGTATNVVAERCRLEAEVRAIDPDRLDQVLTELVDTMHDAVDAAACDLDVDLARLFSGYRARADEPAIVLAERALRRCGYTPKHRSTGGGADANALRSAGFPCVNLPNGTEYAHEPRERVSVEALEGNLALVLALVEEAAATETSA